MHDDSPLGQIVKDYTAGPLRNLEFCSKWFFETSQGLVATRDVRKLLLTKQYYNKKNATIYGNPYLHRLAIYEGFKSE